MKSPPLMPGMYYADLYLGDDHHSLDTIVGALSFEVLSSNVFGTGKLAPTHTGPVWQSGSWAFADKNGRLLPTGRKEGQEE